MSDLHQLNTQIIEAHNAHYVNSETGLVNPKDSPNGNQIYHLYSTGEITFQKGGWGYMRHSEFHKEGRFSNYKKMGLKLPMEAGDGTTYAILTQDECYKFHNIMLSLLG
jgi:hypothetical protein